MVTKSKAKTAPGIPSWIGLPGQFLTVPPLAPDLERRFQVEYYARIRPSLRLVSLLLAGLMAIQILVESRSPMPPDLTITIPQFALWLSVFGLTCIPGFGKQWRPALVLLGWTTAIVVLGSLGHVLADRGGTSDQSTGPVQKFFFVLQMAVLMVSLSTLRLPFRWMAMLQVGVVLIGLESFGANPSSAHDALPDMHFILLPALVVLLVLLLASFAQEQLARNAFWVGHLLEEERNDERRQREQTEGKLQVLAQAIGSIVHDLGNPLTVVQMGAELVELQADSGDPAAIRETNQAVRESAQILSALRLSLIEQTRVLEGKPIPVDLHSEPLRPIIDAGAHFQSPRFSRGRTVTFEGEDLELCADRMRLITVFMNLIGNALKYSDGDVRIAWRTQGDTVLVGVMDQGTKGRGISEAQARRLFIAFGRLEDHANVEGTGLGLVSARNVVAAHGGDVFVEGYQDGTAASSRFTTAPRHYPSLLEPGFLTGFVVACPVTQ